MTEAQLQFARLLALKDDPISSMLGVLTLVTGGSDTDLYAGLEAASVPHWFTESTLAALLPVDKRAAAGALTSDLLARGICEVVRSREGWSVHEQIRIALRSALRESSPGRFLDLSKTAVTLFSSDGVHDRVERIYHLVFVDSTAALREIEQLRQLPDPEHALEYLCFVLTALRGENLTRPQDELVLDMLRRAQPAQAPARRLSAVPASHPVAATPARRSAPLSALAGLRDGDVIALESVWNALVSGELRVVDESYTRQQWSLVMFLNADAPRPRSPLAPRVVELAQMVLAGVSRKVLAVDRGVALSTAAAAHRKFMAHCGWKERSSFVASLLASASLRPGCGAAARVEFMTQGTARFVRVSGPRPELHDLDHLTPAERTIATALAEGLSYTKIARVRGTSQRTVANQIAAVFQKLRVSGRNELIARLCVSSLQGQTAAPVQRSLGRISMTPLPGSHEIAKIIA